MEGILAVVVNNCTDQVAAEAVIVKANNHLVQALVSLEVIDN